MESRDHVRVNDVVSQAIKSGAWLLGLIIVLFFISRHVFPFIQGLF